MPSDVPAFIARRIVQATRKLDLPASPLADTIPDDPAPNARISREIVYALWEHALRAGAPTSFPITTALVPLADMRSAVTFLCTSSSTVGEAVARMVENWHVVGGASTWRTEVDRVVVRLVYDGPKAECLGARCHMEYLLADLVHTARLATGRDLELSVSFTHRAPANTLVHREVLGEHVRFGAADVVLATSLEVLELPLASASAGLVSVLEHQVVQMAPFEPALTSQVRGAIETALDGDGDVRIDVVARSLAVGARTLLRRLVSEGTTYQSLVDDVRRTRATTLLTGHGLSSKEVSAALGFSDSRAFARAFRRWTGDSPKAFRRA